VFEQLIQHGRNQDSKRNALVLYLLDHQIEIDGVMEHECSAIEQPRDVVDTERSHVDQRRRTEDDVAVVRVTQQWERI